MFKRFLVLTISVMMCFITALGNFGCSKTKEFTVNFDPDGGEHVGGGELVQVVSSASEIVEPELEKKGYTVEIMSGDEMNEILQQYASMPLNFGAKGMMSATKGMDEIAAIWFETKEKAENFKSIMDFAMDAVGGQMGQIDFIYGVKGKVFYMGTEQGVKDFF
jgi:hypothetical protein